VARYAALVVDDSESVRRAMEIQLQLYGIKPSFAADGAAALRAAGTTRPDLIFLDITLPDLDGYEVCRRLRAMPVHRATPICIMTSKGSVLDKMKGAMSGCSMYLTKPVRSDQLRAALTKFVPGALGKSAAPGG
jgi:twitching motility two-component system response regulator PilG